MTHESRKTFTLADTALAYLTLDDSGRILTAQPGGDRDPNLNLEALTGTPLTRWIPETFRAPVESGLRQLADTGSTWLSGQRLHVRLLSSSREEIEVELAFERVHGAPLSCTILRAAEGRSSSDASDADWVRARLTELSEWLIALSDNNPDLVTLVDSHGVISSVNDAVTEILGYDADALIGESIDRLFIPEDQSMFRTRISAPGGVTTQCEATAHGRSGEHVELRIKLIPVSHEGEIVSFWVVATDITDRQHHMSELQATLSNLEAAQRIAHLGSFEWDLETDRLYWSDGLYEIFGVDRETFPATFDSFFAMINSGDRIDLMSAIDDALNKRKPYKMDLRIIRPDGGRRILHAQGEPVVDEHNAIIGLAGTALDISDRKALEEQLNFRALHDPLTGLPNRDRLMGHLENALAQAGSRNHGVGLLFVDVDNFKAINDQLGHLAGDQVLIALAQRLQNCLRADDMVARLAGDEFIVVIDSGDPGRRAVVAAERILEACETPIMVKDELLLVTASIGVVTITGPGEDSKSAIHRADVALYEAKRRGKAGIHISGHVQMAEH